MILRLFKASIWLISWIAAAIILSAAYVFVFINDH